MHLRVFADQGGVLHLQISSPSLKYERRLFVPLLPASDPIATQVASSTMVDVWYRDKQYKAPYLLVYSEEPKLKNWKDLGEIEENDSRNVLNHILDILACD